MRLNWFIYLFFLDFSMNKIVLFCYFFLESMLLHNNALISFISWLNLLLMFFLNNVFYLFLLGNQYTVLFLIVYRNRFMLLYMRFFFDLRIMHFIFFFSLFLGFDLLCSRFFNCSYICNSYLMATFFLKDNLLLRLHFILFFFFYLFLMLNFLSFLMMLFLLFCLNMFLCIILLIIKMLVIDCLFDFRLCRLNRMF